MAVWFHSEYPGFHIKQKRKLKKWISNTIHEKGLSLATINYSFLSDDELLEMNNRFLKHDFYTDIISFDYSDNFRIAGDIFISIDRIKENAKKYNSTFQEEMERVIIHGILHFLGLQDKSTEEAHIMRQAENECLQRLHSTN